MTIQAKFSRFLVSGALLLAAPLARSQTFDVKGLDISKGSMELGLDNSIASSTDVQHGGVRSWHDQSLDYGVFDWYRLSLVVKLENPDDDDVRFARTAIENLFVLSPVPKAGGVGLGWFTAVELSIDPSTTNSSTFGPIIVIQDGKLSFTANPLFETTFGRNRIDGIALNYGWNVKYQIKDKLAVGVEGFGLVENLGDSLPFNAQEHRVGPALFTNVQLTDNLTITPDIGLLFGLTDATPDITIKFNVGIPLAQLAPVRK